MSYEKEFDMQKSEFNKYIENYIDNLNNKSDKRKVKFFLECLENDIGKEALDNPMVFGMVDKDYLLSGLLTYIDKNAPSKGVAEDYRRTSIELCKEVCKQYKIKNEFLESAPEQSEFIEISKLLIKELKESKSRECISFEDYEILDEEIRDFFSTEFLEEKIVASLKNEFYKPNYYERLISAIALKLVQKYGLSNKKIANLKIIDLNTDKRSLSINDFILPLDEKLFSNFTLYLKYRDLVIQSNDISTEFLFIKKDGTPYLDINGSTDSGQLFLLMYTALGHTSTTKLRYKTIIELVSKRVNVNLLSELTDVSEKTIGKICIDDDNEYKGYLYDVLDGSTIMNALEEIKRQKGQIRCPFCGEYKDASSENWLLIQVKNEDKKHLACKDCRGRDGKYRY